jgi:hypothetical protein
VSCFLKHHVREFFRVGPARNDHHPAIRCAIGVAVPLLTLLAMGRYDLMIFASFGAFTGIYGRGETHRERFLHQGQTGIVLVVTMMAGALTAMSGPGPWTVVIGTVIVAGLGSLITTFFDLRPRGSLFYIFAYAAISSIPLTAQLWEAFVTAAASVLLSMLIGISARVVPSHRQPWAATARPKPTAEQRREFYIEALLYAAAAAIAGGIATAAGLGHNYWAMIAAVVPLVGPTVAHRVGRGVHRVLGTFAGLAATMALLAPQPEPWVLVLIVVALQFAAEMFILRHYSLAQIFVTPLALTMTQLAHRSDPMVLVRDRAIETVIGAAVGMALVVIMHQRTNAEKRIRRLLRLS